MKTTIRRKLKQKLGAIPAGEWVTVTPAFNQPNWKEKKLVFIEHASIDFLPHILNAALVSMNDGYINP